MPNTNTYNQQGWQHPFERKNMENQVEKNKEEKKNNWWKMNIVSYTLYISLDIQNKKKRRKKI